MSKHLFLSALRRLQDKLAPKNDPSSYLSKPSQHKPPTCPHCGAPLSTLAEEVFYTFHWDDGRFAIEGDGLRELLCPRCGKCLESSLLRALVNHDSSLTSERRGGENKT